MRRYLYAAILILLLITPALAFRVGSNGNLPSKANVGLGAVQNLAPDALPISTATQAALNAKLPIVNPVVSGTLTTDAADGTHMIECANTGAMDTTGLTTANAGRFCYDQTLGKFRYWNGTALVDLAGGGGGGTWGSITGTLSGQTDLWNQFQLYLLTSTYNTEKAAMTVRFDNLSTQVGALKAGLVALGGTLAPNLTLRPTTKNYGSVTVGSAVYANYSTFNTGLASATSFTRTEPPTADYTITADTCGNTLSAGDKCYTTVKFEPTGAGTLSDTLTISAATLSPVTASLTGTGVLPGPQPVFTWHMENNSFPVTSDAGGVTVEKYLAGTGTLGTVVAGHTGNGLSQNATNFTYWYIPGTVPSETSGKIDLWAKHDTASGAGTTDQRPLFTNTQTTNGITAYFVSSTSSFYFYIYDSAGVTHRVFTTSDTWAADTWYHYEFEWDATAGTMSAKRNGESFTNQSNGLANWSTSLPSWDSVPLRIGSTYPIGAIDEFNIY